MPACQRARPGEFERRRWDGYGNTVTSTGREQHSFRGRWARRSVSLGAGNDTVSLGRVSATASRSGDGNVDDQCRAQETSTVSTGSGNSSVTLVGYHGQHQHRERQRDDRRSCRATPPSTSATATPSSPQPAITTASRPVTAIRRWSGRRAMSIVTLGTGERLRPDGRLLRHRFPGQRQQHGQRPGRATPASCPAMAIAASPPRGTGDYILVGNVETTRSAGRTGSATDRRRRQVNNTINP